MADCGRLHGNWFYINWSWHSSHSWLGGNWGRCRRFAANSFEFIGDVFQAILDDVWVPIRRILADVVEFFNGSGVFLKGGTPVRGLLSRLTLLQKDEGVSVLLAGVSISAREVKGGSQRQEQN